MGVEFNSFSNINASKAAKPHFCGSACGCPNASRFSSRRQAGNGGDGISPELAERLARIRRDVAELKASQARGALLALQAQLRGFDLDGFRNGIGLDPRLFDALAKVAGKGRQPNAAQMPMLADLILRGGDPIREEQALTGAAVLTARRAMKKAAGPV